MLSDQWDDIVDALRHSRADAIEAAAGRLREHTSKEDLPHLAALLRDDDPVLREAAAWPFSELAGPAGLRELLVAFQRGLDQGHDNDGLTAALTDLAFVDPSGCRSALLHLAESETGSIRDNAIWLLGFCES